jgi:hypothetical protein
MSSVNGAPTSVMTSGAKQAGTVEARYHQYQVVGRLKPSAQKGTRKSTIYKMNVFAPNSVVAKSRFWYYMSMLNRVKKANGEILQINEVTGGSRATRCCTASCPSLARRAAAAPATRRAVCGCARVWLRTCLAADAGAPARAHAACSDPHGCRRLAACRSPGHRLPGRLVPSWDRRMQLRGESTLRSWVGERETQCREEGMSGPGLHSAPGSARDLAAACETEKCSTHAETVEADTVCCST